MNKYSGTLCDNAHKGSILFRVSKEAKIDLEEDEYIERFKPFMMDIVHEWTKGASFRDIIKMTDMFEVELSFHRTICMVLMVVDDDSCRFGRIESTVNGPHIWGSDLSHFLSSLIANISHNLFLLITFNDLHQSCIEVQMIIFAVFLFVNGPIQIITLSVFRPSIHPL